LAWLWRNCVDWVLRMSLWALGRGVAGGGPGGDETRKGPWGMVTRQWNRGLLVLLILGVTGSFAALSIGVSAQGGAGGSATTPVPRDDTWWQERHEAMNERVAAGDVDLIFIGDSITQGWEGHGNEVWEEYYGNRNAVNLGISGDRTQHVLWRLANGNIDGIAPKLAVVMIGTNNYLDNSAEEIGGGIQAVVRSLRSRLPETKVLLLGIFPREQQPGPVRDKLLEASEVASKAAAQDAMVRYLDLSAAFLDDEGALPAAIMPDYLHPQAEGYTIWAAMIEPHVAELMGDVAFESIFTGTDLTGWEQVGGSKPVWFAEDGLLYTDGGEGGGWLSTTREYDDFVLELEFRVPENGNSGVFIRAPRAGNPAFAGSEIQILDDYGSDYTELEPWQYTASLYAVEAPARRVTKPAGEWQRMRIYAQGPEVRVTLNDVLVTLANQDAHPDKLAEHPGLKRYSGYIGLQNHGSRLDFRNIRIRDIQYD
jgi:lysophospholipase L1-like esterase